MKWKFKKTEEREEREKRGKIKTEEPSPSREVINVLHYQVWNHIVPFESFHQIRLHLIVATGVSL